MRDNRREDIRHEVVYLLDYEIKYTQRSRKGEDGKLARQKRYLTGSIIVG